MMLLLLGHFSYCVVAVYWLNIDHLLYDRLLIQYKQCGMRFMDDALGRKEMEDHLDMHFRQNHKASQNIGHARHSCSWFVDLQVCFSLN